MSRKFAFFLGLIFLAGTFAADVAIYARSDILRAKFDALVSEAFVSRIEPGEVEYEFGGAVEIRGARLMRPDDPERVYGEISSIRVRPDWWSLLTLNPRISEVRITRPVLHVAWDSLGRFDMPSPLRPDLEPGSSAATPELPRVTLDGLVFVFEDCPWLNDARREIDLPDFNVTLEPERSERWLYRFNAMLRSRALGDLDAAGRFSAERFLMTLRRDEGFLPSEELVGALKPEMATFLRNARLAGSMKFGASVIPPTKPNEPPSFEAHVDFDGVTAKLTPYELELQDLRGRVAYIGSRVTTEGLTAAFEGGALRVHGYFDPAADPRVKAEGEIVGLALSSAFGDRVATLPEPCPTIGEQIRQWDPQGFCDVAFSLLQKKNADGEWDLLRPAIDVSFRGGMTIAYAGAKREDGERRGFNYRLSDVRGLIRFTDLGMSFDGVTASNGPLQVEARGEIDYEFADNEQYDVDVKAYDLPLDDRVGLAIGGPGRVLYQSLDAAGSVDLRIAVKRKKPEPVGARVEIAAIFDGVSLFPDPFPLDIDDIRGEVIIDDEQIRIPLLTGRHRGGRLKLVDSFLGQGARSAEYRFNAETDGLRFEEPLVVALAKAAPDVARELRRLSPTGLVAGKVAVANAKTDGPTTVQGFVEFSNLGLASDDPPFRITDASGIVRIDDGRVRIGGASKGRFAGEPFAVEGAIEADGSLELAVEGSRMNATPRLFAELCDLSPQLRSLGEASPVLGPVEVRARIFGNKGEIGVAVEKLSLRGASILLPGAAARFDDAEGEAVIKESGEVHLTGFRVRAPWPADIAAAASRPTGSPPTLLLQIESLHIVPSPPDAPDDAGPTIIAGSFGLIDAPLGAWLYDRLPLSPERRTKLVDTGFGGVLTTTAGLINYQNGELLVGVPAGRIADLRFGTGIRAGLFEFGGRKSSLVVPADGGFTAEAELSAQNLFAFEIPAQKLTCRLKASREGLLFDRIGADLLDYAPPGPDEPSDSARRPYGRIESETSSATYAFYDGQFGVRLRFVDVDVAALVRSRGGDPGEVYGLFGGSLDLAGLSGDEATYVGEAKAKASLRKAVELPFFFQLFNRLDLLSFFKTADPPTKVSASFEIKDRLIRSTDVVVDARDVVLRGEARVRFDGYARADLGASYSAGILPWTWLMSAFSSAVAPGVIIEGPVKDLQIRIETPKPNTPLPPESRPAEPDPVK